MKVAVVILNWNGRALLEQFLPSVVKYSPEAVVYVADNASEDDSVAFVRSAYPEARIIQNKINGGFAKGYNDALQHVTEDIIILLNSDVEVTPGWIPPLLLEFEKDPKTVVLQPKILDFRKRNYFEYAGAAGGFVDSLGYPYCRGRVLETLEEDVGQYDDTVEVFWASGACMAIRKEAFYRAGQFDENYFAHQEEIDLCWRLNNLGLKVKAVGNSSVFHLGGATLDSMNPQKTFFNFRNSLFNLLKNAPGKKVFIKILLRMLLDGVAGIKFLLELKPSHTAAIIRGHFSFYSHFKNILKKRTELPQKKKYFQIKSVVLAYYLIGKRRFGNL